jgi:HEAT repeat protein
VTDAGPIARAAELATLGHRRTLTPADLGRLHHGLVDDDTRVRAAALGALVRAAPDDAVEPWQRARTDSTAAVRRRVAELAPPLGNRVAVESLFELLADPDVTVVEAAAWAIGEAGGRAVVAGAVPALTTTARDHRDPLAREAAIAALGALGDREALPAILAACHDKPAVRRRAVLALAPFDGPEVNAAITAALDDRDWQVRQAAEDLRDG